MSYTYICTLICALLIFSSQAFAAVEDTSIITELEQEKLEEINAEALNLKSFTSCEDLETVTNNFLKDYKTQPYYRRGGVFLEDMVVSDSIATLSVESAEPTASAKSSPQSRSSSDFSGTNEQVAGVSESEIIKTDGEYIYYIADYYEQDSKDTNYQDRQKKDIYILEAESLSIIKKIALPKHFWGTKIYLQ